MSLHTNTPYLTALLASLALLSGCHPHAEDIQATNADKTGNQIDSLVSVEWLMNNLEDPNLVILDASVMIESDGDGGFRTVNGRGNFEAGHIPTAGFAWSMVMLTSATPYPNPSSSPPPWVRLASVTTRR